MTLKESHYEEGENLMKSFTYSPDKIYRVGFVWTDDMFDDATQFDDDIPFDSIIDDGKILGFALDACRDRRMFIFHDGILDALPSKNIITPDYEYKTHRKQQALDMDTWRACSDN